MGSANPFGGFGEISFVVEKKQEHLPEGATVYEASDFMPMETSQSETTPLSALSSNYDSEGKGKILSGFSANHNAFGTPSLYGGPDYHQVSPSSLVGDGFAATHGQHNGFASNMTEQHFQLDHGVNVNYNEIDMKYGIHSSSRPHRQPLAHQSHTHYTGCRNWPSCATSHASQMARQPVPPSVTRLPSYDQSAAYTYLSQPMPVMTGSWNYGGWPDPLHHDIKAEPSACQK